MTAIAFDTLAYVATKEDIRLVREEIRRLELEMANRILASQKEIIVKIGGMLAASIVIIVGLISILHLH